MNLMNLLPQKTPDVSALDTVVPPSFTVVGDLYSIEEIEAYSGARRFGLAFDGAALYQDGVPSEHVSLFGEGKSPVERYTWVGGHSEKGTLYRRVS